MNRVSGFTLIELMLVAALIGLIAMIATPAVSSTDFEQRARAESLLLEVFRTARQEALRSEAICGVWIDINAHQIVPYRYDPKISELSKRRITQDETDTACLIHPVTRAPFVQSYGNGTDYPRLALTWDDTGFQGRLTGEDLRKGNVQFDTQGMPWVFDGTNTPVPLTLPTTKDGQGLKVDVGEMTGGRLMICPFTGRVLFKSNPNANDVCEF